MEGLQPFPVFLDIEVFHEGNTEHVKGYNAK